MIVAPSVPTISALTVTSSVDVMDESDSIMLENTGGKPLTTKSFGQLKVVPPTSCPSTKRVSFNHTTPSSKGLIDNAPLPSGTKPSGSSPT